MPVVKISMLEGRTREQKAALARAITDAFVSITKIEPTALHIVFDNVSKDDWAHAGKLMSEPK